MSSKRSTRRQSPASHWVERQHCPFTEMAEKNRQVFPNLDIPENYLEKHPENYQMSDAYEIKKSALAGRGIFAKKRIEKGSLIFTNSPLLIGPRADKSGDVYCTNCYKITDTCYSCSCCGLTICSELCQLTEQHVRECNFLVNSWKIKQNCVKNPKLLGQALIYLRSLLLNESDMQLLKTLQRTTPLDKTDEIDALQSLYHIPKNHIQFMKLISSILKINSFRISTDEKKVPKRGLYPVSAFMNHSCIPNTRNIFTKDDAMAVYAAKDIEIGEEILSCYTGLLWCTPARRCQLYKTKRFWCKCGRCEDSTELGTRLSALKCLNKDCVGVLLPVRPLDPNCEWRCDNCSSEVTPDQVRAVQGVIGSLVGTLDLDDQFRLETCILERLALFIPYSSHIFVELRLRLAMKLGFGAKRGLLGNTWYYINLT